MMGFKVKATDQSAKHRLTQRYQFMQKILLRELVSVIGTSSDQFEQRMCVFDYHFVQRISLRELVIVVSSIT